MMKHVATASLLAGLVAAAGCTSSGGSQMASGPSRLMAAPQGQVASRQLPPPPAPPSPNDFSNNQDGSSMDGGDGDGTQVASLGQNGGSSSSGGGNLTRQSVLGAYKVTAAGGNCQIILSLTEWTGGYRAASRGCPGRVADVSAWDVSGSQVVLKNSSGSNIASLNQAGASRFEGSVDGQQISLYR